MMAVSQTILNDIDWTDEWPAALSLECPECGKLVEPYDVAELRLRRGEPPARRRVRSPRRSAKSESGGLVRGTWWPGALRT